MEGKKTARAIVRSMHSVQRRFLAFVLAAAMTITNVGVNVNTAYAASSSESVTFSMSGSQLVQAIEDAIANGNEVTADDLDFTNGKIAEFEELLLGRERFTKHSLSRKAAVWMQNSACLYACLKMQMTCIW